MKRQTFVKLETAALIVAALNIVSAPVMYYAGHYLVSIGNFVAGVGLIALVAVADRYVRRSAWKRIREEFSKQEHP